MDPAPDVEEFYLQDEGEMPVWRGDSSTGFRIHATWFTKGPHPVGMQFWNYPPRWTCQPISKGTEILGEWVFEFSGPNPGYLDEFVQLDLSQPNLASSIGVGDGSFNETAYYRLRQLQTTFSEGPILHITGADADIGIYKPCMVPGNLLVTIP